MEEVAHCWWWLVDGGWWMLDGSGSLRAAGYQTQKRVTEWANPGMGLGPLDGLRCMGNWNKWLNGKPDKPTKSGTPLASLDPTAEQNGDGMK